MNTLKWLYVALAGTLVAGCGGKASADSATATSVGGAAVTGGASATGASLAAAGSLSTGGDVTTGGTKATGGTAATGGAAGSVASQAAQSRVLELLKSYPLYPELGDDF